MLPLLPPLPSRDLVPTRVVVIAETPPEPLVYRYVPDHLIRGANKKIRAPYNPHPVLVQPEQPEPPKPPPPIETIIPAPTDRSIVDKLWPRTTQDLVFHGYCTPRGVREGIWEIHCLTGELLAVMRYYHGRLMGTLDLLDAAEQTVARYIYLHGRCLSMAALATPRIEQRLPMPGTVPLGIKTVETDDHGIIWEGLRRGSLRVGTWRGSRSSTGHTAELRHFHMETGEPIGYWEQFDEVGSFMGTHLVQS